MAGVLVSRFFWGVEPAGSKLWRYSYRFDAKQKLLAIGRYPLISLADARIKRDDAKKLLAEGIDPPVERKAERRDAREMTICDEFVELCSPQTRDLASLRNFWGLNGTVLLSPTVPCAQRRKVH
jgi:hypothetical protein